MHNGRNIRMKGDEGCVSDVVSVSVWVHVKKETREKFERNIKIIA